MEKAKEAVDNLYSFRDHYFEKFPLEKAIDKNDDVKKEMTKTVQVLEGLKDEITNKAIYHMLRGRALNVLPTFDPLAEEALSKAVKLDPKLVDAWNELGESYWKKGEVPAAKNCFVGALGHVKNKVSLRNLSMVLKQLSGSPSDKLKMIEESVEKAKDAVQLDIHDGTSWLVLGNAYLSLFFAAGQNPKSLKQSMSAYLQAEKDSVAKNNPDLHFNRSVAFKYEEDYQAAVEGFSMASKLDPTWTEPGEHEKNLMSYLTNLRDLTEQKGKIKDKKIKALVQTIKDVDLGPYAGGKYTGPSGKTINLVQCKFCDLKPQLNAEKVILGKVVCTVQSYEPVPFSFCMVDDDEQCLPVNVYNLSQGSGVKIGDSVSIPEPYLQTIKVSHKDVNLNFNSIRVNSPLVLVVNGKKLGIEKQAPSVLAVSAVSQ
ncbi:tetratricopeptide repeat protein 5-like [Mytilus galloprovincialis]|uniref:tetratricopeptide repeat protein 5-like n=1 Tax=Mytilus galloprovincialis TaxID=29158 RepID=UPI003F7B6737